MKYARQDSTLSTNSLRTYKQKIVGSWYVICATLFLGCSALQATSLHTTNTLNPQEAAFQVPQECLPQLDTALSTATADTITIIRGDLSYGTHTPITINRSGVYRLAGPLTASGNTTALTISANNVALDLGGNTISGGATGINVTGNTVSIKNGTIQNASTVGISITGSKCQLDALEVINSGTGFLLQNTNSNALTNCRALSSSYAGFSLVSSYTNSTTNCQALNTSGNSAPVYGFISQSGYGNIFTNCLAQNTKTAATNESLGAAGFLLTLETASRIQESRALNILSLASTTTTYGIFFDNTHNCACVRNTTQNTNIGSGFSIGIRADSSVNYIAANTADNNDNNYQDVASDYITSQANARGVYNIDTALNTPDSVETANFVAGSNWSIESKCELISSQIDQLANTLIIQSATIESKLDIVDSKLDTITPTLITNAGSIESKLEVLAYCNATPITSGGTITSQKTDITNDITLTASGCYCLSSNTNTGSITIAGDNISLDLNGYTLNCSGKTTGLTITGNEVSVRNGAIKNATAQGVLLSGSRCTLENIDVISSPTGFYLNGISKNNLTNCRARSCTNNGFVLANCTQNRLTSCAALTVGGAYSPVHGFYSTNGLSNTFDGCTVTHATTSINAADAIASGFGFANENYSAVANCTINDVSTAQSLPVIAGINAQMTRSQEVTLNTAATVLALSWIEFQGQRYLATGTVSTMRILQYTGTSFIERASASSSSSVNDGHWGVLNGSMYVAWNRQGSLPTTYFAQISRFTPPATFTSIDDTGDLGDTVNAVRFLADCTPNNRLYLAVGTDSTTDGLQIYSFNGTTLTSITTNASAINTCDWLTLNPGYTTPNYYLAIGANTTATYEIQVFQFNGSTLTVLTGCNATTTSNVTCMRWLTTNTGTYYLAVSYDNVVNVYEFIPTAATTGTLTLKASYNHTTTVNSVSWLPGVDDLNYLAICGGQTARVLQFNGSCLTEIQRYIPTSASSLNAVDWLTTGSTLLAVGSATASRQVAAVGYSPTRNIFFNNTISGVRGGADATAFAVDANNVMLDNKATNNDTNYFYTPGYGDSNQGY